MFFLPGMTDIRTLGCFEKTTVMSPSTSDEDEPLGEEADGEAKLVEEVFNLFETPSAPPASRKRARSA